MASELDSPPSHPDSPPAGAQAARSIVRLPDARFFVRTIPVATGATAADVAGQVELALETLSPFPIAQLYHGYFWPPGQPIALIYAAYRRRFTTDETDAWQDADLVIPSFVSVLGLKPETGTTVLVDGGTWMTGVHWGEPGAVPSRVLTESLPAEASGEDRASLRDGIVRALGGSLRVIEVGADPELRSGGDFGESDYEFAVGGAPAVLPASVADAIDVRDKQELGARRKARTRDLFLWRVLVAMLLLILFAAMVEAGLVAVNAWQKRRLQHVEEQRPQVEQVMNNDSLIRRIAQLSETLRPFEMIDIANDKPDSIYFLSTEARDVNVLVIEGTTRNSGDVGVFEATLRANPAIEKVELSPPAERDGVSTFRVTLTFKAAALRAAAPQP